MENKTFNATVWYTISSFIIKGVVFLSIPLFLRILTKYEFGIFSNYTTWCSIITIIASLSLYSSLVRARFDFKDDLFSYVYSNLLLGSLVTLFIGAIFFVCSDFFRKLFVLDNIYLLIMIITILVSPAYEMFISICMFNYKYKIVVLLSVVVSISSIVCSFILIYLMDNNLLARIIGMYTPTVIISISCYLYFIRKKCCFNIKYCKYALAISTPYIFHLISGTILNGSDKSMITLMCGAQDNAIYSMGYNVGIIISVLWGAMNSAFSPIVGECINEKKYNELSRYSKIYLSVFSLIVIGVFLFAPEIVLIMGGEQYKEAMFVVPPVVLSYFFVFIYSFYVNIEQYEKKTKWMAIATCGCAMINLLLNTIFIKIFGYIAASYTTLLCYVMMAITHYLLVKRIGFSFVYDTSYFIKLSIIMTAFCFFSIFIYQYFTFRIICVVVFMLFILFLYKKYNESIKMLMKGVAKS